MTKRFKLCIVDSHPVQYRAPIYQNISKNNNIDLSVYYIDNFGIKGGDVGSDMGVEIKWDIPLLKGYNYEFLSNKFSVLSPIRKNKFDGVLIYGWNSIINWITIFTCLLTKTPLLLQSESPLNQEKQKPILIRVIKKVIFKYFLFKFVSAFLYIGKQNKKFYKFYGVPERKLFFTPYAVDNKRFQKSYKKLKPKRTQLRKELNIKQNDIVVLFVGKLIHKKRPIHLLKAYKKNINIDNTHLIFVGSGRLKNKLKEYRNKNNLDNVHFVGFKNQTELPKYYTMADIFVLPSGIGETWGLVVNEAMNFELPIIISDIPGSGYDLVKEDKNGYKFPVGNIDELSKKLKIFINNSDKRKKFGKKSFKIVQNYSYEKDIEGILKSLKSIK